MTKKKRGTTKHKNKRQSGRKEEGQNKRKKARWTDRDTIRK